MARNIPRTLLRTASVLLAAGLVVAAAWALTPSYDPKRVEAETAAPAAGKMTPAPRSEDALRRVIGEIQRGRPDYTRMSTGLSAAMREQLPQSERLLADLGPLQSVAYLGGARTGSLLPGRGARIDRYRATFHNGSLLWGISLGKTSVIESLFYDDGRPPTPQDWIDNYARFRIGERAKRMATQFAILLIAVAFGRFALRLRL